MTGLASSLFLVLLYRFYNPAGRVPKTIDGELPLNALKV